MVKESPENVKSNKTYQFWRTNSQNFSWFILMVHTLLFSTNLKVHLFIKRLSPTNGPISRRTGIPTDRRNCQLNDFGMVYRISFFTFVSKSKTNVMKTYATTIFFLFAFTFGFAQKSIKGKVIDEENQPLEAVVISLMDSNKKISQSCIVQ